MREKRKQNAEETQARERRRKLDGGARVAEGAGRLGILDRRLPLPRLECEDGVEGPCDLVPIHAPRAKVVRKLNQPVVVVLALSSISRWS